MELIKDTRRGHGNTFPQIQKTRGSDVDKSLVGRWLMQIIGQAQTVETRNATRAESLPVGLFLMKNM